MRKAIKFHGVKDFHGVWICGRQESYNAAAVNDVLERMGENPMNMAQFTPIY
jgi:hypothetical protein